MNKKLSVLALCLVLSGFIPEAEISAQTDLLDSLRNKIQQIEKDSSNLSQIDLKTISDYLHESKSEGSKENIIYAYQQLASVNYQLGNSNLALKYYKLYVLELEEFTKIREYRDQKFENNLYENEIRALNRQIEELELKNELLVSTSQITYEKNYLIYIGLRVMIGIGVALLLGWLYLRFRKPKQLDKVPENEKSNTETLTEILNSTKGELVAAQTELSLSDILVQRNEVQPEANFEANKSLRKKFLIHQPKGLSGGTGLYLHSQKNQTIIGVFNSPSSGAAGGLLISQIYAQMDEIVRQLGISSPSLILEQLEKRIAEIFPAGIPFSGGVSTAILVYDSTARVLTYGGADMALFDVEHGILEIHTGSEKPLLEDLDSNSYKNEVVEVGRGNNFYLCTKGFWNQNGGHDYRPLGQSSFEKSITSIHKQSMADQKIVLANVFNEWMGGNEQEADLLIFGFGL